MIRAEALPAPARYLDEAARVITTIPLDPVQRAIDRVIQAYEAQRLLLVFGNGGSASTASHLACDLGKSTLNGSAPRPRVLCLNDNVPLMTALSNDVAYDAVFAEQVETWAQPGDLVIAISASGNSPNIVTAVGAARRRNASVIGLSGFGGGELGVLADVAVVVESSDYAWVESAHLVIEHLITYALRDHIRERYLLGT
jgi:D-sedoheptulose 7-phosphate isomerase